jgi:DNA-binding SARP family transcriptional activator
LLAYLLLQRHRSHSREELAALFWGEQSEDKARGCLNTALWRLRCALEPSGSGRETYLQGSHVGEVEFNRASRYWLDVAAFEEPVRRILAAPVETIEERKMQKLRNVMQLYRGELLEGFYDDWALRERERLRTLYLNGLAYLMKYEKYQRNYENGLSYGRQILELDPLREEIHRELMRLYVENQQRPLAIRQYKACCEMLRAELDIEPMQETQALYAQIMLSAEPGQPEYARASPDQLRETLQDLQQVAQSVERVHGRLTQAIGSIQSYIQERSKLPRV